MEAARHIKVVFRLVGMRRFSGKSVTSSPKQQVEEIKVTEKPLSPLYSQRLGMFIKPGVLFSEYPYKHLLTLRLYIFAIASLTVIFFMIKIVPPGHVGLVVRKDGKIDQFNNTGRLALFYIPFVETPVAFRTTPIKKKIIRTCKTADGKDIEIIVFLTLQAKLAFASDIYSVFGGNFSNAFVEKELCFDIDQVVKKYNKESLLVHSDKVEQLLRSGEGTVAILKSTDFDKANNELVERFQDAGAFNKIAVSDVSISYREPQTVPVTP